MGMSIKTTNVINAASNIDRKDAIDGALYDVMDDVGEYLVDAIQSKFGNYQDGWAQLKPETVSKEIHAGYGDNASRPLMMTGDMKASIYREVVKEGDNHILYIKSNDEKLIWHMYGIPRANVPARDPVRPTVKQERDKVLNKIKEAIKEVFS